MTVWSGATKGQNQNLHPLSVKLWGDIVNSLTTNTKLLLLKDELTSRSIVDGDIESSPWIQYVTHMGTYLASQKRKQEVWAFLFFLFSILQYQRYVFIIYEKLPLMLLQFSSLSSLVTRQDRTDLLPQTCPCSLPFVKRQSNSTQQCHLNGTKRKPSLPPSNSSGKSLASADSSKICTS